MGSLPRPSTAPALTCSALGSSYLDVQDGLSHPSGSLPGRPASAPPGSPPRAPAAGTASGTADTCNQSTAQLVSARACADGGAGRSSGIDSAKERNTVFCCCLNSYCSDPRGQPETQLKTKMRHKMRSRTRSIYTVKCEVQTSGGV